MSVPKTKRKLSSTEYYHTGLKIRQELTSLMFRNFGLKPTKKELKIRFTHKNKMISFLIKHYFKWLYILFDKNIISPKLYTNYPQWYIEEECKILTRKLSNFIDAIDLIYHAFNKEEIQVNKKIALKQCYLILEELQGIICNCNLDIEKYSTLIKLIYSEIHLLEDQ